MRRVVVFYVTTRFPASTSGLALVVHCSSTVARSLRDRKDVGPGEAHPRTEAPTGREATGLLLSCNRLLAARADWADPANHASDRLEEPFSTRPLASHPIEVAVEVIGGFGKLPFGQGDARQLNGLDGRVIDRQHDGHIAEPTLASGSPQDFSYREHFADAISAQVGVGAGCN